MLARLAARETRLRMQLFPQWEEGWRRRDGCRSASRPYGSEQAKVRRRAAALLIRLEIELKLLTFGEVNEPCALKGGRVDEDVLAAVYRLNEAKAFCLVVKLDYSSAHLSSINRGKSVRSFAARA